MLNLNPRLILVATLAVLCGAFHQPCAAGIITSTVNPANGNTYYLLTENSWTASQAEAVSLGGNLVTINDQAENDWVFDIHPPREGSEVQG